LGLVFVFYALCLAPELLSRLLSSLFYKGSFTYFVEMFLRVAIYVGAACWLFLGAPPIGKLAYPEDEKRD